MQDFCRTGERRFAVVSGVGGVWLAVGVWELTFIHDTIAQSYVYKNFYETNIVMSMFTK